jgi:NADP-dependent 3-hydroxy acid dehydrogenase YdfG
MKDIVVVTGAGIREVKRVFTCSDPKCFLEHSDKKFKLNAAAGAAVELSKAGYIVYMLGNSKENLDKVCTLMPSQHVCRQIDLLNKNEVKELAEDLQKLKEKMKRNLHLVHYGSASDTKSLPNGTLFLDPWESPSEAITPLIENSSVALLNLIQAFRPIFKYQVRSKVVVISAVASTRPARLMMLDTIQKGAIHAMTRSLALDLTKENIFVTEIMPGTTDTGFYDDEETLKRTMIADKEFGYEYKENDLPMFSGNRVGQTIVFVMEMDAHIREISLIPFGQFPHLGA